MPNFYIQEQRAVWMTYFHEVDARNAQEAVARVTSGESEAYDSTIGDSVESFDPQYEVENE